MNRRRFFTAVADWTGSFDLRVRPAHSACRFEFGGLTQPADPTCTFNQRTRAPPDAQFACSPLNGRRARSAVRDQPPPNASINPTEAAAAASEVQCDRICASVRSSARSPRPDSSPRRHDSCDVASCNVLLCRDSTPVLLRRLVAEMMQSRQAVFDLLEGENTVCRYFAPFSASLARACSSWPHCACRHRRS